jgi:DNA-binding NarL/FixJ family response regulator
MVGAQAQRDLFPNAGADEHAVVVNDRCLIRTRDRHRVVLVAGIVLAQYAVDDRMAEAHAMVSLVEQGWAQQTEVARAFRRSPRTLRRQQHRVETGGLAALGRPSGYPAGRPRLKATRLRLVARLKGEGLSNRALAQRLGVSEKAVRKLLRRIGWTPTTRAQETLSLPTTTAESSLATVPAASEPPPRLRSGDTELPMARADPNLSASDAEELPVSWDADPADRRLDRLLAYLGLLDDAAPLFRSAERIPRVGVLLALPPLVTSGVFTIAREVYGSLGPAFYGLRTTVVALLLLALLRIKRPEALKEHAPDELGRLLGLDRAPEVKTLRRKLSRLAAIGRATEFGRALARHRVAARGAALGFLYVDGHVRVYHGQRTLPKAHVARRRLAMPATTDYWVNDATGDPLFIVTAEANAGMVAMLPRVLEEVRTLVGERRITIVFDRGGYSPRLFLRLIAAGFDILTYRKGQVRRLPRSRFHPHEARVDGRPVAYLLADQGIRLLGGQLRLRQVTRRTDDGHQTPILTSRRDLTALEVAQRMFDRWRQENFFKYLREEYALDALVDYGVVPDDPTRDVPNPRRHALDAQLRHARAELARLATEYGAEAFVNPEHVRPTMRGFKIAHGPLAHAIRAALQRVANLEAARSAMPHRVAVAEVVQGDVVRLAPERKLLTNLIKMVAYQAESDLVRLLAPHYKRIEDEGRTFIQAALAAAGDLLVTDTELRVILAPLSSPHRTRALSALCEDLDRTGTRFPGTRLRLRYAVGRPG